MRGAGRGLRAAIGFAVVALGAGGCQLIGGIGDIALSGDGSVVDGTAPDVVDLPEGGPSGDDASVTDATVADAAHDATGPGDAASPSKDGGGADVSMPPSEAGAHDAGPPPAAACTSGTECVPSGGMGPKGGEWCDDGAFVPCGSAGDSCCPGAAGQGSFCSELETVCSKGMCEACGQGNGPCCPGDLVGICGLQQCCDPTTFACIPSGSTCSTGGTCAPPIDDCQCGEPGQSCCGTVCEGGDLACVTGRCVACGGANEPCCDGSCTTGACDPSTGMCSTTVSCGGCGGTGEMCCGGAACVANDCCDPTTGGCVGQGATCSNGYRCESGSCACGAAGSSCCTTSPCSNGGCCDAATGLCAANARSCGTRKICDTGSCVACGASGQPCCQGSTCYTDGGTCSSEGTCS